jgi:hypothetical protein
MSAFAWCHIVVGHDYGVRFGAPEHAGFLVRLATLKTAIPPEQRRFDQDAKCWRISPQAKAPLKAWFECWFEEKHVTFEREKAKHESG